MPLGIARGVSPAFVAPGDEPRERRALTFCYGVIRGALPDPARPWDTQAVALFAVLLWLQSDRSADENEAVLEAAADIALARAAEVEATVRSRDLAGIAALYRKYVGHV